ncbi:MAG: hypothetical protein WC547_08560 [Candidatus Omnitrophota bacterium]
MISSVARKKSVVKNICAIAGLCAVLCSFPMCANSAEGAMDAVDFATLTDEEKNDIVTGLFQRQEFDRPQNRAICRELLQTQGRFSFANGALFTEAAIDLVEKQAWFEYDALIAEIYKFPSDPRLYKRAFLYLRTRAAKSVPVDFIGAWDTIEDSCVDKTKVDEKTLEKACQRISGDTDKEMVLVYALSAAASGGTLEPTDRCQWIAIDILKALDRRLVVSRLKSFQPHPDTARSISQVLDRIRDSLSVTQ